jgi:hypothetical protein
MSGPFQVVLGCQGILEVSCTGLLRLWLEWCWNDIHLGLVSSSLTIPNLFYGEVGGSIAEGLGFLFG